MKVVGFAGFSGSGKTTLVEQLIPELRLRGLRVSVVKHAHHSFDIDHPGKDTYRHREACLCPPSCPCWTSTARRRWWTGCSNTNTALSTTGICTEAWCHAPPNEAPEAARRGAWHQASVQIPVVLKA